MLHQQLVPALVRDDCVQREIQRICVALKRLGVDCQQIHGRLAAAAVLGATALAVNMPILDPPDESEFARLLHDAPLALS